MARFYVRCRTCGARATFSRHPEDYQRPPRCWSCGRRAGQLRKGSKVAKLKDPWAVDKWMMRRNTKAQGCACLGYNWGGIFHRRGSLRCWYNTDGSVREPSDEELELCSR